MGLLLVTPEVCNLLFLDLLVSGSSGIPRCVTLCVFVSATSADSVGQFRLPLVYSFGLQHAAIRAFPDHSVSSCALQPYWLDSAYKFGFGAGRRSSPRADVKMLREWKFCDKFSYNEREEKCD